jgi:hypothetical protein
MKKNFIHLVLSCSALFVFTSVALAQNTGTISGTVQDQSGAVVAGANVKAQNPATKLHSRDRLCNQRILSIRSITGRQVHDLCGSSRLQEIANARDFSQRQ